MPFERLLATVVCEFRIGRVTFLTSPPGTLRSIQLVCRQWNALIYEFGIAYRYVVIHNLKQLRSLVLLLEQAYRARKQAPSPRHGPFVDVGRHVTHVKIVNMPLATSKQAEAAFSSAKPMTDLDVCRFGLSGSYISYFRRFLACCPNIQFILDTTSQHDTEQCLPFLDAIHPDVTTRSTAPFALEYTQGHPSLRDIYANPPIANTITRLRGLTLQFPPESFTHGPLSLPNLTSFDMHVSPVHHTHWLEASRALTLPSLSHLTVRAPFSAVPFIGARAMSSLKAFLAGCGSGLKCLELIVGNAPVATAVALTLSAPRNGGLRTRDNVYDVPALLRLCPTLEELILDANLIEPALDTTILGTEQVETVAHGVCWSHKTLRRVGIRGSHINALLTNIAFVRAQGYTLKEASCQAVGSSSPSSLRREDVCDFCRIYGRPDSALAESVISRCLAFLLGLPITTGAGIRSSESSFHPTSTSTEELYSPPPLTNYNAMKRMMRCNNDTVNPLTEIYFLPPSPNTPKAPGEVEMRSCCLRSAPSYTSIPTWQELCRAEGVALRFVV